MKKLLIISGFFIATFAFAQVIDYPVPELNNCQDKEACRQYCDVLSNTESCLNFAEARQLFTAAELQEARKLANALKEGAETPGNCQNKADCNAYCDQREHVRECFNFAKEAGLIPQEELEQAEKSISLIEKGESPGGCIGKEGCNAYCSQDQHKEECMNFAIKAGLMNQEEAERFRKTGGKGPGGCQSEKECDAFCNDPANRQTCFEFGKEHDLISQEEINMIQEEVQKMQEELQSAPPEVVSCLNEKLGSDKVEKLKSGNFMPGPNIGESTKECFEKYYSQEQEEGDQQLKEELQSSPSEVINCLEEKLGSELVEKLKSGTISVDPETDEVVKFCFEEHHSQEEFLGEEGQAEMNQQLQEALQSAPSEVLDCLNSGLGSGKVEELKSGATSSALEEWEIIESCFEEHHSQEEPLEQQEGEMSPSSKKSPPPEEEQFSKGEKESFEEGEKLSPSEGEKNPPPEDKE